ncbi:MAG: type III pantothenate kinase [Dehalococcoidia bacterium]|nr:type III pantothenate kinase [Dehalococcoidia bacterium]
MLLALDIGNTNITIGVFEDSRLAATWRIATDTSRLPDEYAVVMLDLFRVGGVEPRSLSHAVMASVVPSLTPVFEEVCQRYFKIVPLVVGAGIRTGLRILYDTPREVGADRVVDAVAALHAYGPPPLVVVDFGTATVFDAVNAEGDYLGGAIAPGVGIAAQALFEKASLLWTVKLERPRSAIGKNTANAMQAGIMFGYVGLVEGIVNRFREELGGTATVIATGGLADLIASETDVIDHVDKDLTLRGLQLIEEMNRNGRD